MDEAVLGSRFGKRPNHCVKVKFGPRSLRYLAQTLASEQEELRHWTKRPSGTFEGDPRQSDFVIGQDAIAACFRSGRADFFTRAHFYDAALDRP